MNFQVWADSLSVSLFSHLLTFTFTDMVFHPSHPQKHQNKVKYEATAGRICMHDVPFNDRCLFIPVGRKAYSFFLIIKEHKWQRQWQRRCRQRGINWRKVGMKGKDKSMGGKEKFPFPWQIRDRVEGRREADRWRDERRKNFKKDL